MTAKPSLQADEAAFQAKVVELAKAAGWMVNHTYRARAGRSGSGWRTTTTAPGFPDLLLLRHGRQVVLELKMPGNHASDEQNRWVSLFQSVPGVEAYVVWPADWDEIVALLTDT